jgi:hypothetical protein
VIKKGRKVEASFHFVEVTTHWPCDGRYGNSLRAAYELKNTKYMPLRATAELKRPGYKAEQATIAVSPTGAIMKESVLELSKGHRINTDSSPTSWLSP